jgi:hypothetical protein
VNRLSLGIQSFNAEAPRSDRSRPRRGRGAPRRRIRAHDLRQRQSSI